MKNNLMTSLEFCPILDELYRTGGAVDAAGVRREAEGLSTSNNLAIIRALMLELKPKRTVEIGLAAGGSALTFAASHRDLGSSPARQHVAIDPYQRAWHRLGVTLIERAGLKEFTEIIEELSCLALPSLMREGRSFELIYIDGSHAFHEALLDFYYARHLLSEGGIVLFDDCTTPDIVKLMRFIRKNIVSFREFDLRPFLPPERRWRYRIARTLNKAQCIAFQKVSDPQDDESWQWKQKQ
jgi:predicted O-methyltransferase YrrM